MHFSVTVATQARSLSRKFIVETLTMRRGFLTSNCACNGCNGWGRTAAHSGPCDKPPQNGTTYGAFCKRCYRNHLCTHCGENAVDDLLRTVCTSCEGSRARWCQCPGCAAGDTAHVHHTALGRHCRGSGYNFKHGFCKGSLRTWVCATCGSSAAKCGARPISAQCTSCATSIAPPYLSSVDFLHLRSFDVSDVVVEACPSQATWGYWPRTYRASELSLVPRRHVEVRESRQFRLLDIDDEDGDDCSCYLVEPTLANYAQVPSLEQRCLCLQSDACNHSPYLCTQLRTETPNTGGMCGVCLENSTCDCGAVIPFTAKTCPQCGSTGETLESRQFGILKWGYRHSLRLPYVDSARVSAPTDSTIHRKICGCTDVRCTSHLGHPCQQEIRADAAWPPERIHSFCIACNKYHLGWREENSHERFCRCWSHRLYGCPCCALSHRFRPGES